MFHDYTTVSLLRRHSVAFVAVSCHLVVEKVLHCYYRDLSNSGLTNQLPSDLKQQLPALQTL